MTTDASSRDAVLEVRDLEIALRHGGRDVPVVDGLSFRLSRGETLALVGESGCGKSVTALALLRLVEEPLFIRRGAIELEGTDLLRLGPEDMRRVRGRRVAMVFQEPMTALNPVMTVGEQIAEALLVHGLCSQREAMKRAVSLLDEVGIPDPGARSRDYPHQLSGGMRQRVLIAMALSCGPSVLVADEPTTALDVTIQAQILELMRDLQQGRGLSVLWITHDLGVVGEFADRVAVMYAGRLIEEAPVRELFENPLHPYTRGLFGALPSAAEGARRLAPIEGVVPAPADYPPGCRFHPRCPERHDPCVAFVPDWTHFGAGRKVACFARDRRAP